jgi:putative membrane protein
MNTPSKRLILAAVLLTSMLGPSRAVADEVASVLTKLHHSNQKEVHMGQEAKTKGHSPAVKEYGATLERDHTAADEKVAALARKQNIELPPPPAPPKHEMPAGEAFDKHFAKMMVDDHTKDIATVKAARDSATDPELKELLTDLLPTLEKHLETARTLAN